ncbi:MAG: HAMP domain-containing sensor histidine kinase [Coriobacteriales bacterium]|nr:HAMP domain-containing sensor histidine kinase [Coriobacteriales bacterium]
MNSAEVSGIRRKFILIAMLSFFVVISFTTGMTSLANQYSLRTQAGHALELIVRNHGEMPEPTTSAKELQATDVFEGLFPEFTYSARYFSVLFNPTGDPLRIDVKRVASVDEAEALEYARGAVRSYEDSLTVSLLDMGLIDTFFYKVKQLEDGNTIVAFLDCSFQMQVNREVGVTTLIICAVSLIGSFVMVVLLSKRAIRPEIENARRQKQFITNASHELKTPLAVIRANTEVIEMLEGESEWTQSTMSQVDRMDGLVQNLVMIARAAETEDRSGMGEIDVAAVVTHTVDPFRALARQENKELVCTADGEVRMVADASAIQQLCTLLVDNAIKYCDDGGQVLVEVASPRRGRVTLTVSNSFAEGKSAQFGKFFERFYRDDEAHTDEGGYGIGLSVAESICTRYGGSIKASWKNGMAVFTCQLRSA